MEQTVWDDEVYTTFVQIRMPSGRTVTAQANCRIFTHSGCHLSITICVHAEDMRNSLGLCGNYDGSRVNDLVIRDTKIRDLNFFEPVLFAVSYM